jgi:chromosome segregation ATPase
MPSHTPSDWDRKDQDEYEIKSNLSSFSMIDRRLATFCQGNRLEADTAAVSNSSTSETINLSPPSSNSTRIGLFSSRGRDGKGQSSPTPNRKDVNGEDDYDEIMQCRREADVQESQVSPYDAMRTNADRFDFATAIKDVSKSLLRMQHGESVSPAYSEEIDTDNLGRVKHSVKVKIEKDKSEGDRSVAVAALEKELLQWPKTLNELNQSEVSELKSSLSTIEVTLYNSQEESSVLKIDNQTMATEISALSTLCAMLSAEKGELKKSLAELQGSHEELEEEIIALVEDVDTKVAEINLLSELSAVETSDLRGRLREVEDDSSVMLDRSFVEHDEQRERNETQIRDIEAEVASLQQSIADAEEKRREVEIEKSKLAAQVESLSSIASNGMSKEEGAQELIRTLVNEMREGTAHFNSEIKTCKTMLRDLEERNYESEAVIANITAAFESMSALAASRLTERDEAEARLCTLRSEMEDQAERYEISIKDYAMEVGSLRETNDRMQAENEKLISQVETLSASALKKSTPVKEAESPIPRTDAACGVDLDKRVALREAASRLKYLSDQESPSSSPRASKGLRLGKKKQWNLTQQNRPDTGKLQQRMAFPEMGSRQQFFWLCALWSITLLLLRVLS